MTPSKLPTVTLFEVARRLERQNRIIRAELPAQQADPLIRELTELWTTFESTERPERVHAA